MLLRLCGLLWLLLVLVCAGCALGDRPGIRFEVERPASIRVPLGFDGERAIRRGFGVGDSGGDGGFLRAGALLAPPVSAPPALLAAPCSDPLALALDGINRRLASIEQRLTPALVPRLEEKRCP